MKTVEDYKKENAKLKRVAAKLRSDLDEAQRILRATEVMVEQLQRRAEPAVRIMQALKELNDDLVIFEPYRSCHCD